MKVAALLAALLLGACATGGRGPRVDVDVPVLGPLQAALLYHDRSHTPLPADQLVQWYGEVCGEKDPEARRAAAATARPELELAGHDAARADRWRIPLRQDLGGYDLVESAFPTTLRAGAAVTFDRSQYCGEPLTYRVVFRNGADYALVRIPHDEAVAFVRNNPARSVVHDLVVEVVGAQDGPGGPALVVDILGIRTRDAASGTTLAETVAGR
jgi:hypothetical protein